MKKISLLLLSLLWIVTSHAQECPTPQRAAFAETQVWCADLIDGLACYGNGAVSSSSAAEFDSSGDLVPLTQLETIGTHQNESAYGVVRLQTHSYVASRWQEIPLALALIGETSLTNHANEQRLVNTITTTIQSAQGANVRTGTNTDHRILRALLQGDTVKLIGRLSDNSWLRVQLPNGDNGWIVRDVVDVDTSSLAPADLTTPPVNLLYAPYTDIELRSGSLDAPCAEAPESGLLLQSPMDLPTRLRINGQDLALQGTLFAQADENTLYLYVIEGQVQLGDASLTAGYTLRIDSTGMSPAQVYDFTRFETLPTEILPRYTYIGLEIALLISPAPLDGSLPLADILVDEPCTITTGETGANLRAGPSRDFPIRGVLAFRETARPIGRTTGSDGVVWWELAQNVWISAETTVTGGDCISVPQSQRIPVLPEQGDS